jgi:hypothetical protein
LRAARDTKQLTPAQADVFLAPRPAEELYYTPDDPNQLRNLADEPEAAEMKQRLATRLNQWSDETGDAVPDFLTPDEHDRETGQVLGPAKNTKRGDYPGKPRNAASINLPGPR